MPTCFLAFCRSSLFFFKDTEGGESIQRRIKWRSWIIEVEGEKRVGEIKKRDNSWKNTPAPNNLRCHCFEIERCNVPAFRARHGGRETSSGKRWSGVEGKWGGGPSFKDLSCSRADFLMAKQANRTDICVTRNPKEFYKKIKHWGCHCQDVGGYGASPALILILYVFLWMDNQPFFSCVCTSPPNSLYLLIYVILFLFLLSVKLSGAQLETFPFTLQSNTDPSE